MKPFSQFLSRIVDGSLSISAAVTPLISPNIQVCFTSLVSLATIMWLKQYFAAKRVKKIFGYLTESSLPIKSVHERDGELNIELFTQRNKKKPKKTLNRAVSRKKTV